MLLARGRLEQAAGGDAAELEETFARAEALSERLGDVHRRAEARCWRGIVAQVQRGDDEAAVPLLESAAAEGDDLTRSYALRHLGIARHGAGDLAAARTLLEDSTDLRRALGLTAGVAANLVGLGWIAVGQQRWDDARRIAAEARRAAQESTACSRRSASWRTSSPGRDATPPDRADPGSDEPPAAPDPVRSASRACGRRVPHAARSGPCTTTGCTPWSSRVEHSSRPDRKELVRLSGRGHGRGHRRG